MRFSVSPDPPAMAFSEDLIRAYPDAKVVLVERDVEVWYESMMVTVVKQLVCEKERKEKTVCVILREEGDTLRKTRSSSACVFSEPCDILAPH